MAIRWVYKTSILFGEMGSIFVFFLSEDNAVRGWAVCSYLACIVLRFIDWNHFEAFRRKADETISRCVPVPPTDSVVLKDINLIGTLFVSLLFTGLFLLCLPFIIPAAFAYNLIIAGAVMGLWAGVKYLNNQPKR